MLDQSAAGSAAVTLKTPTATVSGRSRDLPGRFRHHHRRAHRHRAVEREVVGETSQSINSGTTATRSVSPPRRRLHRHLGHRRSGMPGRAGSGSATITRNIVASITTQPANKTTTVNTNVTVSVVAAGTSPIFYQWFKNNGTIVTGATSSSYTTSFPAKGNYVLRRGLEQLQHHARKEPQRYRDCELADAGGRGGRTPRPPTCVRNPIRSASCVLFSILPAIMPGDFLGQLPDRHVGPRATRDELVAALKVPLSDDGEDPAGVLDALVRGVDRGLIACAGPRYFGFVIGGSLPVALAADWLTSDVGSERRHLRDLARGVGRRRRRARMAARAVRPAAHGQRRLRHRRADGELHGARRGAPRRAAPRRLERRGGWSGRRAAACISSSAPPRTSRFIRRCGCSASARARCARLTPTSRGGCAPIRCASSLRRSTVRSSSARRRAT